MRLFPLFAASLALAGCVKPGAPGIEVQTVTVTKEVQRPCAAENPPRPASLMRPLPTDAVQLAAVLALKLEEYAAPGGYADRADAAIETCTKGG